MPNAMAYDEVVVGEELGPWSVEITEQVIRDYCDDWDDHNPYYLERGPDGGPPVAPPAFMAGLTGFRLLGRRYDASTTLGASTHHVNLRPIRVGETLRTEGRIVEKYLKRGKAYVVVESTSYDDAGNAVRHSRDHIALGLDIIEPA